jgi:hypothetical protein
MDPVLCCCSAANQMKHELDTGRLWRPDHNDNISSALEAIKNAVPVFASLAPTPRRAYQRTGRVQGAFLPPTDLLPACAFPHGRQRRQS